MQGILWQDLSKDDQTLVEQAQRVLSRAYCPYSQFRVGAALRCIDGTIITGVNVENASYGMTICAERGAVMNAYAQGKNTFDTLALIAQGTAYPADTPASPCGACRQVLFEAAQVGKMKLRILLVTTNKSHCILTTIEELLPLGFGPRNLDIALPN